jgi:hypothetical protein
VENKLVNFILPSSNPQNNYILLFDLSSIDTLMSTAGVWEGGRDPGKAIKEKPAIK